MKTMFALLVILSSVATSLAATYYVAPGGSNTHPGSLAQPFATIQHAVNIMQPGDICLIRGGIYTESITLQRDGTPGAPITLSGYPGERALLTAADKISGWKPLSSTLYEAPLGWDLGMGENQVYIDGVWAHEARWPNITQFQDDFPTLDNRAASARGYDIDFWGKYLDPQRTTPGIDEPYLGATCWPVQVRFGEGAAHRGTSALGDSTFEIRTDPRSILFGKPRDYWVGTGFYAPGGWFASGVVIDKSWDAGEEFYFQAKSKGMRWVTTGYFFGHRDFIDKPHEWVIKNGKIVMSFAPGENPATMDIRAKRRVNLINLSNRTAIHVKNLAFHGTGIQLDSAYHCIVDNCHFKYLSHYELIGIHEYGNGASTNPDDPILVENKFQRGIRIGGSHNQFINSSIEYSGANGLIMRGSNNVVENNFFRMISYKNSYAAPLAGLKPGDLLKRNTIDIAGRSAINGATGGKVILNHFKNCMATSFDGGALYTWGQYPLNMEIAYNWFNNLFGRPALYLYCDAGAFSYSLHHNVFMATSSNRFVALSGGGGEHFNNTWVCPHQAYDFFETSYDVWFRSATSEGMALNDLVGTRGREIDTSWLFENVAARDFRLRKGSRAIDAGVPIPGITDGYVGKAPDLGAYEYGVEPWVPGHTWGAMPTAAALWSSAATGRSPIHQTVSHPLAPHLNIRYNPTTNALHFDQPLLGGHLRIINLQGRTLTAVKVDKQLISLQGVGSGMFYYWYEGKQGVRRSSLSIVR